jgi:hypothetical protein
MRIAMRLIVLAPLLFAASLSAAADNCSEIVAATVAEMRAGETGWDERAEAIARRAAGAACVKASSMSSTSPPGTEEPFAEAASAGPVTATAAAAETAGPDETDVPEDAVDDGKAGWKFLGFDVNKVDGSPSQKPYDRKR